MKKFSIPTYATTIFVYTKVTQQLLNEYKINEDEIGFTCCNVVYIRPDKETALDTCVHETVHIVDWIFALRLTNDFSTIRGMTEARAYLTEFIFKKIWAIVSKELKEKRK